MAAITLAPEQEERARRLHAEAFVYDFSPHGEPIPRTARTTAVLEAALAEGAGVSDALRRLWIEHLTELEEDPAERERWAGEWRAAGVNAVQATLGSMDFDIHGWDAAIRDAARWHRRAGAGDDLAVCTTAAELRAAHAGGKVGVLLGLQDTLQLGSDLGRLETLYGLGVRVIQLTYNRRNLVGDGCTEREQSGLSRFGVELVRELDRLGIVVDVSHSGEGTTRDALELSERPAAFTHVSCKAVADHPRGKSDEQLRRLAEQDGYAGIVAVPFFLRRGPGGDLADMMDHVVHAAEIVGVERVGIATDWGFWSTDYPQELHEQTMAGFRRMGFRPEDGLELNLPIGELVAWRDWHHITRALVSRGFGDDEVRGILGGNWLRYLDRVQAR